MKQHLTIIILLFFSFLSAQAQVTNTTQTTSSTQSETTVKNGIGRIGLQQPKSIVQQYTYNPALDRYVYTQKLGKYALATPMFLTVKEYEDLVMRERMSAYYRNKLDVLGDTQSDTTQKKKAQQLLILAPNTELAGQIFEVCKSSSQKKPHSPFNSRVASEEGFHLVKSICPFLTVKFCAFAEERTAKNDRYKGSSKAALMRIFIDTP